MGKPLRIGIVGYDGVQALDIAGPMDVFDAANACVANNEPPYEVRVMSIGSKRFRAENGLMFQAHAALGEAKSLDTIIVPGGAGIRTSQVVRPIAQWLQHRNGRTRRLASVCTGTYALAEAGILNGRRATTHWRFAADLKNKFPQIALEPDAIFVQDGSIYSSAGVTAGIDLALAFVEDDLGESVALAVARELVVYLKRPGGQTQFSEPLQFQTRAMDRFNDLAAWMLRNLKKDMSVEALAARANLSSRQFSRKFKAAFTLPPAEYVEKLRLDEARFRLRRPSQTVESVAASVGYSSADVFRRAFERRFGVSPNIHRRLFAKR